MPARRLPVRYLVVLCLCGMAPGCVTEQSKPDGSFVTGGPGKWGQPAPATTAAKETASAKSADADYKPSAKLQLALAQYQEQHGYRDEARRSYEQVLAGDGKSIEAVIGLARLDQVAGRTADAEAGFQKAIQMDPRSGLALDALGQFYAAQNRWNDALSLLQRARTANPEEKTIRFHYAVALARTGRMDQAMPLLVESVGPAAAHYNIGLILHDQGDLPGSEEQFVAAIMANPRLEPAQYWLNEVRREMEQVQQTSATGANGGMASGGRHLAAGRDGIGAQAATTPRMAAGVAAGSRANAGIPVEPAGGLAGQRPLADQTNFESAGHSGGSPLFAPAPQMAAPVSPLARRDAPQQYPAERQPEEWNNQR
jgi:tetratricopeptide (TPR) repeat protein